MAETVTIRTLERIDDPKTGSAKIAANVTVTLPKQVARKLVAEGKAEEVKNNADKT